jgi:hypothetical protein
MDLLPRAKSQCEAMVRKALHFRTGLGRACYHRTNKQAGVSVVGLITVLGGTSHRKLRTNSFHEKAPQEQVVLCAVV